MGWWEGAVFARYDAELGRSARLLLVPTVFHHWGNSPNGMDPGRFTAVAQGVGLQLGTGPTSITPSILAVYGRVDRSHLPGRHTEATTGFVVLGVTVGLGG